MTIPQAHVSILNKLDPSTGVNVTLHVYHKQHQKTYTSGAQLFTDGLQILNMMDTNAIILGQEKKGFVSTGVKMLMVNMTAMKLAIVPVVRADTQTCILVPIFKEEHILVLDTTTMIPDLSQPTVTLLKRRTSMELKC